MREGRPGANDVRYVPLGLAKGIRFAWKIQRCGGVYESRWQRDPELVHRVSCIRGDCRGHWYRYLYLEIFRAAIGRAEPAYRQGAIGGQAEPEPAGGTPGG